MNDCNDCLYADGVFYKVDYEEDDNDNCLSFESIKTYEKGKLDGAREFLAWYSGGETMPSFGRYAKCNIDDVIAEWQKGAENE